MHPGAEAVICDLETASAGDVAVLLSGADAAVFDHPGTRHQTLALTGGDSPVAAAVPSIS